MKRILGCVALAGLAGCSHVAKRPEVPDLPAPPGWEAMSLNEEELLAAEELAVWWTLYDDQTLTDLVQRSLDANLELQSAVERIEEASALRRVAAGEQVPAVNASGAVQQIRLSDAEGGNLRDDRSFTLTSAGLDASWELDLFGRIRSTVRAADANLQAAVEAARGVRALVAAQVVDTYVSLRELRLRQRLAMQNVERQRETLRLTRGRFDAGLVPELDVHQAELNLARTEAVLPSLRQREIAALRGLEVLAGLIPGELQGALEDGETDVPLPGEANLNSVPVNVLRRRPDVRAAEQRLMAAAAQVNVARASLYPRISLSGQFAWSAEEAGDLFESGSLGAGIGPQIVWPFFQGGRLEAQLDAAQSRAVQAGLSYRQTALEALAEVENALTSFRQERIRQQKLSEGVDAAAVTVRQVRSLYENGLVTFLNVLDAERNLAAVQDEAAASLGQTARNLAAAYRAMGGGWDAPVFTVPETAVDEMKELLSTQTAEVSRLPGEPQRFRVQRLLTYEPEGDDVPPLEMDPVFTELPDVISGVHPGERVRIRWKREQVTLGDLVREEQTILEAERLSTPSP